MFPFSDARQTSVLAFPALHVSPTHQLGDIAKQHAQISSEDHKKILVLSRVREVVFWRIEFHFEHCYL